MKKRFGKLPIIAEDLGFLTPSVLALVKKTGFPGMKVLELRLTMRVPAAICRTGIRKLCGLHGNP